MRRRWILLGVGALGMGAAAYLTLAPGRAPFYPNAPLAALDPQGGYREEALTATGMNTDGLAVILTFSGGGTRAAALAYGALQGLSAIEIPPGASGPARTLLDEVDQISAVSGGSFTALAFGLWGPSMLTDGRFESRFLRADVQGALIAEAQKPSNIFSPRSTSELAAAYYDQHLFEGATYGDLLARQTLPFISVNATDMARLEHFQFNQRAFDLLGADLSALPLAWAAAASSAFPPILAPVRLRYFHGPTQEAALRANLTPEAGAKRPWYSMWARDLVDEDALDADGAVNVEADAHRFLYLLDGGAVDNLGLSSFLQSLMGGHLRRRIEAGVVQHILVVVVDAGKPPAEDLERSPDAPGILDTALITARSGIYTTAWLSKVSLGLFFHDTHPLLQQAFATCWPDRPADPLFRTNVFMTDINFGDALPLRARRRFFNIPTAFALEKEEVDALIDYGRRRVLEDPEIGRLLATLGGAPPTEAPGVPAP